MEPTPYEYTLKESSQFKKDLKAVKFDEHKLDELQKERDTHLSLVIISALMKLSVIIPENFAKAICSN